MSTVSEEWAEGERRVNGILAEPEAPVLSEIAQRTLEFHRKEADSKRRTIAHIQKQLDEHEAVIVEIETLERIARERQSEHDQDGATTPGVGGVEY